MIPQSYFRYEPISPTYDPNEFVKNYNKESHQNFANFDRPEKGRIRWYFEIEYFSQFLFQIEMRQFPKFTVRRSGNTRSLEWDAALLPLPNNDTRSNLAISKTKKKSQRRSAAPSGFHLRGDALFRRYVSKRICKKYLNECARLHNSRYYLVALFDER